MIRECLLATVLMAQEAGGKPDGPVPGDCARDPETLVASARELLAPLLPQPPAGPLSRARALLRAARRGERSAALDLFAADLAFLAGDAEEGGDLLAAAAEGGALLSPPELLFLARRAEERRRWNEAVFRYDALRRALASSGETASWITPRIRELELEAQAASIAPPSAGPPAEARLALADGKRALSRGNLPQAREKLQLALRHSPGYVEALLALSSVERRAGRVPAAIRAAREALAAEPDRVESLTALSSLLWEEPDRQTKEESLALLDRAVLLRPSERALLRLSVERHAELGDASGALERLERFRAKASSREKEQTAPLFDALVRRARGGEAEAPAAPAPEEQASDAVDRFRKAQVYAERGDPDSLATALALLAEAEKLDPSLARAPELAASIHRRLGARAAAEQALRRAVAIDPSRASANEELARLLEEDPSRGLEAAEAWRRTAEAGSTEALYELARRAESEGRAAEALAFFRRYADEAPASLHAAEAAAGIGRLLAARARVRAAGAALLAMAAVALSVAFYRRRSGSTLEEWLADHPGQTPRVRPILGRLRHEALKHGGLLFLDGARRLEEEDAAGARDAARLLCARLYSEPGAGGASSRGLVTEANAVLSSLRAFARADGVRLNLERRDPLFSSLLRGLDALARARPSLERVETSPSPPRRSLARAARLLRLAARRFGAVSGAEVERLLDRSSALPVRLEALQSLLARVAEEKGLAAPTLEPHGALDADDRLPRVRIAPLDWETVWRNLFANALDAGRARPGQPLRLGLFAEKRRDSSTGETRLMLVLADDLPGSLSVEQLRARPAERGWGVIAELLERNDAGFDVTPPPAGGFTKGIALDLPAAEEAP